MKRNRLISFVLLTLALPLFPAPEGVKRAALLPEPKPAVVFFVLFCFSTILGLTTRLSGAP